MALSVDAPKKEVVVWTLSSSVAENDWKLPESQVLPSGSGLMYEVAGNAAAAGIGGSGCRSYGQQGFATQRVY